LFCATARFFRPGYHNSLVASWLPALDNVVAKLDRGASVAVRPHFLLPGIAAEIILGELDGDAA